VYRAAVVVGIALVALAGVAIAAGGGGSKPVTLCVQKGSGKVLLGAKGKCGKRTKKVVVGKRGPAGAKGERGVTGKVGPPGKSFEPTQPAAHEVAETVGDCSANPGTFCGTPDATGTWSPGLDFVSYRKDAAGWVRLAGNASASGSGAASQYDNAHGAIFFLPPGYRPSDGIHRFYIPQTTCHNPGSISYVDVLPNGAVKPRFDGGCVDLANVVFYP